MSEATYNGWKNYPTWAVNLWLSNDAGLYEYAREEARSVVEDAPSSQQVAENIWTVEQAQRFNLADRLKDWVTYDLAPDLEASFAADLLGYALDLVDWTEIADAWLEEAVTA